MKGLESRINQALSEVLADRLKSIILFGSSMYMGHGGDVDILVVIDRLEGLEEKISLEEKIIEYLNRLFDYRIVFDVHVLDTGGLDKNMEVGSFLSGLALGYKIIHDKLDIEEKILRMLEKLTEQRYIYFNRYGEWNISKIAKITLSIKKREQNIDE
jgi:predicted nucleotidyltransferase